MIVGILKSCIVGVGTVAVSVGMVSVVLTALPGTAEPMTVDPPVSVEAPLVIAGVVSGATKLISLPDPDDVRLLKLIVAVSEVPDAGIVSGAAGLFPAVTVQL